MRTFNETFLKFLFQDRNSKLKKRKILDLKNKLIYWRLKVSDGSALCSWCKLNILSLLNKTEHTARIGHRGMNMSMTNFVRVFDWVD